LTIKINDRVFLALLCVVAANTFVIHFISQERYIYFWDSAGYWFKFQSLNELFRTDPSNALKVLFNSIRNDDYNFLPVLFLLPFSIFFGTGRLAYILALTNIYAIPAALFSVFLVGKINSRPPDKQYLEFSIITLMTSMLFPQFWSPLLFGLPGIAGVLVIFVIFFLYWKEPLEDSSFLKLAIIGLLLAFLIMLRRWYAYWVVSFFFAAGIERVFSHLLDKRFSLKTYLLSIRSLIVMGVISVGSFFLVASPIARKMLVTDYADIYSAYKYSSTVFQAFKRFFAVMGSFYVLLLISGMFWSVRDRKTRSFSLFLIIQLGICFELFTRTQDFSIQHYYLQIPTMIVFISLLMTGIFSHLKKPVFRALLITAYGILLLVNLLVVFAPSVSESANKFAFLFSGIRHYPFVRNDIGEINNLLSALEKITVDTNDHIYVLASSGIFNDDILRNACLSSRQRYNFCDNILITYHVDKRDGFPSHFFTARYVVVAYPVQYHMRPEDQRVVGILANEVLNRKGIGSSFRKLPYEFTLDKNVKVFIYEKIKRFEKGDIENLEKLFLSYYPDRPDKFTISVAN
jgi:hypothetical protein